MSWYKNGSISQRRIDLIAKKKGIIEPQNMSTKELLNTHNRYDSRLSKIGLEKIAKIQNISENELNQTKKLQGKSIDELR